jgi:hypothetical protein
MKAQLARLAITLVGLLGALVIFMSMSFGWLSIGACLAFAAAAFTVSEAVFRRLADTETRRRDLEDRVRNTL